MGKRVLLAALALGLVAAAGAGVGAFMAVRSSKYSEGPVDCGGVNRCIPDLKPAAVVDALKSHGHQCGQEGSVTTSCTLRIGVKKFELRFDVEKDLINSLGARVTAGGGAVGGDTTTSYLVWAASIPYATDDVLLGQIKTWVTQQLDTGKQTEVRIGDYSYEMDTSHKDSISLDIRGRLHR